MALRKLGVPDALVEIIKSFHCNMKARVRVDGELLDEIEVNTSLHQGCMMAPTLFSMYACVVVKRWLEGVESVEGSGTHILYKLNQQLLHGSIRNAREMLLIKGSLQIM